MGTDLAPDVVRTACVDHPLWPDCLAEFLKPLALRVDEAVVKELVYLQHFYPPAAVAFWAMRRPMTEATALDLVCFDDYTPYELAAVCKELQRRCPAVTANPTFARLLEAFRTNIDDCVAAPPPKARTASGHTVEFINDRFVTTAWVPTLRRTPVDLTRALRVCITGAGEVSVEIHVDRLLERTDARPDAVRIRVSASRCASMALSLFDGLYEVTGVGLGGGWTPARAVKTVGAIGGTGADGLHFRFDVRYFQGIQAPYSVQL